MRCSTCGLDLADHIEICPSCGRATLGPVSNPASEPITASAVIYLFAAEFAEPKAGSHKVVCSQAEVRLRSLVNVMLCGAFLSLSADGIVELGPGQRKGLVFAKSSVVAKPLGTNAQIDRGLEGEILATLAGHADGMSAWDIVRKILGRRSMEPYSVILAIAEDDALRSGYLVEQKDVSVAERTLGGRAIRKPMTPRCDQIATLSGRTLGVKQMMAEFKESNGPLYDLLSKEIDGAIEAAYRSS